VVVVVEVVDVVDVVDVDVGTADATDTGGAATGELVASLHEATDKAPRTSATHLSV
jgi:hypothetical protein